MDIVSNLFALVSEDRIRRTGDYTFNKIGKEPVKLRPRMCRPGEATATKNTGLQPEIPSVLLCHYICRNLTCAEDTVLRVVDRH